jgi:predicted lipid carrier protein YhbT
VTNLPFKYNPRDILAMFDRISRVVRYTVYETEVWIRFKAIEDRKVCLFMQGVLVSDKKIKVDLEFSEEDLLKMKQSKLDMDALYFSKDNVQKVKNAHSKVIMHIKTDRLAQ